MIKLYELGRLSLSLSFLTYKARVLAYIDTYICRYILYTYIQIYIYVLYFYLSVLITQTQVITLDFAHDYSLRESA